MIKVTFLDRGKGDKKGEVRLRFRVVDGRKADLTHKSEIIAKKESLKKFNPDGTLKDGVRIYDEQLFDKIMAERIMLMDAYSKLKQSGRPLTSSELELFINSARNQGNNTTETGIKELIKAFEVFIEESRTYGRISARTYDHYIMVKNQLNRFLIVNNRVGVCCSDFNSNDYMDFRKFLLKEYTFVQQYPFVYENVANPPQSSRTQTTVANYLKKLNAFFNNLEEMGLIEKSPFHKLSKASRKVAAREYQGAKTGLTMDELHALLESTPPKYLKEVCDAFYVHCSLGCRIEDMQKLNRDNFGVENGVPYVHYLPNKTKDSQTNREETKYPIVPSALNLLVAHDFHFPILKNASGQNGYNVLLKELFKNLELDRRIPVFNEAKKDNDYVPLYEIISSKAARKTFLDITTKAQPNLYLMGLHKTGSKAVFNYLDLDLAYKYQVVCLAFGEQPKKFNENFQEIPE